MPRQSSRRWSGRVTTGVVEMIGLRWISMNRELWRTLIHPGEFEKWRRLLERWGNGDGWEGDALYVLRVQLVRLPDKGRVFSYTSIIRSVLNFSPFSPILFAIYLGNPRRWSILSETPLVLPVVVLRRRSRVLPWRSIVNGDQAHELERLKIQVIDKRY